MTRAPLVDEGWGVTDSATGKPVWPGRWPTEDGAKQMLRRFQRALNRNGYNHDGERLEVAYLASHEEDEHA